MKGLGEEYRNRNEIHVFLGDSSNLQRRDSYTTKISFKNEMIVVDRIPLILDLL